MLYQLIRPLMFMLDAEKAHHVGLNGLALLHRLKLTSLFSIKLPDDCKPVELFGLTFRHPVGLAAGLDKNGAYIDALAALGFSFIEIGTITPKPQPGNPLPRMFRLPQAQGIINRMGFNNDGVDTMIRHIKASQYKGILGINIGKNAATPIENAIDDYVYCMERLYAYASYITVNISSPNTQGLRSLQTGDAFSQLLKTLKSTQLSLQTKHQRYVPILVKVAPDLEECDIQTMAEALVAEGMDGLIATNTTLDRSQVKGQLHADEAGGLSGLPVLEKSNQVLALFNHYINGRIPIIGVGGICDGGHAVRKMELGAQLVQIYSGFIYQGPPLIAQCVGALQHYQRQLKGQ